MSPPLPIVVRIGFDPLIVLSLVGLVRVLLAPSLPSLLTVPITGDHRLRRIFVTGVCYLRPLGRIVGFGTFLPLRATLSPSLPAGLLDNGVRLPDG